MADSNNLKAGGDTPNTPDPIAAAQNWNNNLGATIGGFVGALVQADGQSKDAYTARVLNLLKLENADFVANVSLVGQKEPLQVRMNVPVISITNVEPILVDDASIEMDMNVDTSINDSKATDTSLAGQGSATVGWGPIKATISVTASMASKSSHKRSSDFRSSTTCKVTVKQGDAPEGLNLVMESINKFVDTATKINEQIVDASLPKVLEDAQANAASIVPAPNTPAK